MSDAHPITIITINLNNRQGLENTLSSVFAQAFTDYQLVVIDGGSTDGSTDVIQTLSHKISYWISEPDRGIYHAMNKGLAQASGQYCLFLNSGDWLIDNYVLATVFSSPRSADILLGDCRVSKAGEPVFVVKPPAKITLRAFVKNTLPHQTTFIRRTVFDSYGPYDEQYMLYADFDYWLRTLILGQCTTERLELTIADYNLDGLSSDTNNSGIQSEATAILAKYFPQAVLDDYYSWLDESTTSSVVLNWVKANKSLYACIEFFYKVAKNIRRIRAVL